MKKLLLFLLIASLLLSFTCSKKTYNYYYPQEKGALAGLVSPPNSNARVSAWQGIEIASTYIDTTTGYFKISELPIGTYSIKVEAEGYETYESKPIYMVYNGGTTSIEKITLAPYPNLIAKVTPNNGAVNVSVTYPITIQFLKPMNRQSVEEAFKIEPPVEGKLTWDYEWRLSPYSYNTYFEFKPTYSYKPNTVYTVILDTTAHDTSGAHLSQLYVWSFTTIGVKIIDYAPRNGSIGVSTSSQIGIVFNLPMDQKTVQEAFSINPEVDGIFVWSSDKGSYGNSYLYFRARDRYLAANTQYTVKIDTTAKDTSGVNISDSLVFSFTTEGIKIEYIYPPDKSWDVNTSNDISIVFNTLMNQASVVSSFSISPSVEGEFSWNGLNQLVFMPNDVLASNFNYVVSIDSTAQDLYGSKLGEVFSTDFNTAPIRVLYTRPENGATYVGPFTNIYIQFNTSMDQAETVNAFRMIDADSNLVSGTFSWYGLGGFYFYPDTTLKNNTEYVVTVSDQAKDIHGIAMPKPFKLWFKTKP